MTAGTRGLWTFWKMVPVAACAWRGQDAFATVRKGRRRVIVVTRFPRVVLFVVVAAGCAGSIPDPPPRPGAEPDIAARPADPGIEGSPRRGLERRLRGLPLPPIPRWHPKVGRLTGQGSLAVGTTRDGFVVGCRPFPLEGPHHRVLAEQARRGTNCGTDEMVAALLRAAEVVAKRYPGAVLPVGNLSRAGGGDIPWSISHNAGRDADVGFYLVGLDGRQVVPDDLVRLDRAGRAEVEMPDGRRESVRLDVRRTWWFVRTLLTDPAVEVQWVFVARPIREMLLEHAKRRGESAALVAKAAEAMAQPRRALPHDDHLHVRIYCAPDDLYEGCRDAGSDRSWHVARPDRVEARVRELKRLLSSRSAATRAAAITVLGRMDRREVLPVFARSLFDRDAGVRLAAAFALRETGVAGVEDAVARAVARGTDPTLVPILLDAVNRTLHGGHRVEVLARLLGVTREFRLNHDVFEIRRTVADFALEELEASPPREAVPVLVRALRNPGVDRAAVHRALIRLTAFDPGPSGDPAPAWEAWWRAHRRQTPEQWYVKAFRDAGVLPDEAVGPGGLEALARVIRGEAAGGWAGHHGETPRRAAWSLLGRFASRLAPGWRRPWPADSIEPWGVLAEAVAGSLLARTARSADAENP